MGLRATRAVAILVSVVVAAGGLLVVAEPASAATTIVVGTLADGDSTNACTTSSQVLSSPVTLRNALCVAGNLGGAQTVQVPGGSYLLSAGALQVGTISGSDITVAAAPGATPTIVGDGAHQVFTLDPGIVGGVKVTLDGLTVSGGVDNAFGGGALIGGSGSLPQADSLVVRNSTFSGNAANTAGSGATNSPGGAIQFIGGALTVTNSTFTGNDAGSSAGGAIAYQAEPGVTGQGLAISGSTFRDNSTTTTGGLDNGGGALFVADRAGNTPMSVTTSIFDRNTAVGASGQPARGGAIWQQSGSLSVTGSTFTRNTVSGVGSGASALDAAGGTLTATYNRITGNTGGPALAVTGAATANAAKNWWGCAKGPGNAGCDTVSAAAPAYTPYLTLTVSATPNPILPASPSSALTATLLTDSAGGAVSAANLSAFDGLPVAWSAALPAGASVDSSTTGLTSGSTSTVFRANAARGAGSVTATLDGGAVVAPVGIAFAPSITSPATATAVVGHSGSFTVSTTAFPAAVVSIASGTLPTGVTFVDNGDGTATLAGTPAAGTAAAYVLGLSAANVVSTVTQTLTLQVQQVPAITSAATATFVAGTPGGFTVTTTGRPTPAPLTVTGALPSGVTFVDNGNGTATLSGTPAAGTGGTHPLTITAANGVATNAAQSFTLTVHEAPRFTSAATLTALYQQATTFTVTTAPGFPVATTVAVTSGSLQAGLGFSDNGDGTATIAGTATATGTVSLTLTTANGSGLTSSQVLTVTVERAPQITLPIADQTVHAGDPVAFTAGAIGFPAPAVHWEVSADAGANWAPIPGETTATLAFTARVTDDGHWFRAVFTNNSGSVHSDAVLTVGTSPTISSAAAAAFSAGGGAQSFAVTTSAFPNAALTASGSLPAWLTLTDNGDGTAALAGTPPATAGGQYPFTITAANGFNPDATQAFTLTVTQAPAFSSAAAATLQAGVAGGFGITTTAGFPAATTIAESGALPAGVVFHDDGDGTATLAGTPAAGSGGVWALTLTAANGSGMTATQTLTVTVIEAAAFTSSASLAVTRGVDVSFTVTTSHASPAVTGITPTGALPAGLVFTDHHDGTATIAGQTVDTAGTTSVQLAAVAPGLPDVVQTLTVVVSDAAVVTMPLLPPAASGAVSGVPASPKAGDQVTLTVGGFAPDAPITFAIYSSPVVLAVVNADALGSATATVTIPAGYTGAHSLVASGIAPDGTDRFVRTDFVLAGAPVGPGGGPGTGPGTDPGTGGGSTPGTPGSSAAGSGLAGTGLDVSGLAMLALLLLAAGAAIAIRRARRPRRA